MSNLTPVLIARLATELEMALLHLKAGTHSQVEAHLLAAEKLADQLREES